MPQKGIVNFNPFRLDSESNSSVRVSRRVTHERIGCTYFYPDRYTESLDTHSFRYGSLGSIQPIMDRLYITISVPSAGQESKSPSRIINNNTMSRLWNSTCLKLLDRATLGCMYYLSDYKKSDNRNKHPNWIISPRVRFPPSVFGRFWLSFQSPFHLSLTVLGFLSVLRFVFSFRGNPPSDLDSKLKLSYFLQGLTYDTHYPASKLGFRQLCLLNYGRFPRPLPARLLRIITNHGYVTIPKDRFGPTILIL
jgi:hypothetical protein